MEPLDGDFSIGLLACLLSARYFSKLPFCVARINYFWDFWEKGLASWSWSGRVSHFRAQNA